ILSFCGLTIALFYQIYKASREKIIVRKRKLTTVTLSVLLTLNFVWPFGFIPFEKLEGESRLTASAGGADNCRTTSRPKEKNKFTERSVCFGVTIRKGKYHIQNNTIFFDYNRLREGDKSYSFAIITHSETHPDIAYLLRYQDKNDQRP